MGGICAVFGDNATDVATEMCRCLSHRGPDDKGVYASGENIALGHNALFINASAREHQPLSNEEGTIWVTFEGDIYNSEQLRKKLEKNCRFRSRSSAELLLHAYEQQDLNCLKEFNGDFAFCLWDSKKKRLFSARDKLGVKPLYYCRSASSKRFLISSEIKALLVDTSVTRKPNEQVIYEYLIRGIRTHTGDTFFEGIKELLPASYIVVDEAGVAVQNYWSPIQPSAMDAPKGETNVPYASRFLELFQDAVKLRIPESSMVGTFLSGGLDSTSVVCVVDRILSSESEHAGNLVRAGTRQRFFSATYPDTEADETEYALEVSRFLSQKIDFLQPSVVGQWNDIREFVYHMDEPTPVFSYYVYWCLAKAASSKVRVTFSGQGPDETLGGHEEERVTYYRDLLKRKKMPSLLMELIGTLPQHKIYNTFNDIDIKRLLSLGGNGKSVSQQLFDLDSITADTAEKIKDKNQSLDEMLLDEVTHTLLLDHLQFGDRASSAFSTETRYPFLDCRLVEFAFRLPSSQKLRRGWTKHVLRESMKGIIPEAIRKRRRKLGTPTPFDWLKDLEQEIKRLFRSQKFRDRGWFNQPAILERYDCYCQGKMSNFEKNVYAAVFWRALNLELWSEIFFD